MDAAAGGADDSVIIDFFTTVVAILHVSLSFRGGPLPCFLFLQKQGRRHKVCAPEFTLSDCSGGDVLTRRTAPSCDGT